METKTLLHVLRCAEADLVGALEARAQGDMENHDWKAHELTITEIGEVIETLTNLNN